MRQGDDVSLFLRIVPAAIFAAGVLGSATAAELKARADQPLQAVLDRALEGDVVRLEPGIYKGGIRIDRPLTLIGQPGAVLDGAGVGNVVTVTAPGVTVRGVTIKGSGLSLQTMDSGVFLEKSAERAVIDGNRFEGNLFGIYVHGAAGSRVERNVVEGLREGRLAEKGNGVSLWNAPDVTVADNTFRYGRDGIFTVSSRKDRFINNRFEQVRFAVHYMYTNDSEVSGNVSVGNHVGYAIMYSNRLVIRNNLSDHDRDYGLLFNYANYAEIDTAWPAVRSTMPRAAAKSCRATSAAWCRKPGLPRTPAADRKNACSSTTPTTTSSATTGLNAAASACTSRPAQKAMKSPATPSSAIVTR
jgi:nitrous oxidase accessory protein